jgi:predicted kinase
MSKPYVVVFAGVPGSSKSSIAHYLSCEFNLPILSNDSIRYEVKEDLRVDSLKIKEDMVFDNINHPQALAEYERRLAQRRAQVLSKNRPVIFDGSVDRRWEETKAQLLKSGYDWFMIDMELSREFLEKLFVGTGREFFLPQLDNYFSQHQKFLASFEKDISLRITDEIFGDRLSKTATGLNKFLDTRK